MDRINEARFMTLRRGRIQFAPFGIEGIGARAVWARIDSTPHEEKPQGREVGSISTRLMRDGGGVRATLRSLAALISMGCTVLPGVCVGKRSPDCWRFQDLFFIDVDNDTGRGWPALGYLDAVERAFETGLPLALSYESFSSSPNPHAPAEAQRYRLVFAAGRTFFDRGEAERYARALMAVYPEADRSTTQLNRMFYGTDKEVVVWQAA